MDLTFTALVAVALGIACWSLTRDRRLRHERGLARRVRKDYAG